MFNSDTISETINTSKPFLLDSEFGISNTKKKLSDAVMQSIRQERFNIIEDMLVKGLINPSEITDIINNKKLDENQKEWVKETFIDVAKKSNAIDGSISKIIMLKHGSTSCVSNRVFDDNNNLASLELDVSKKVNKIDINLIKPKEGRIIQEAIAPLSRLFLERLREDNTDSEKFLKELLKGEDLDEFHNRLLSTVELNDFDFEGRDDFINADIDRERKSPPFVLLDHKNQKTDEAILSPTQLESAIHDIHDLHHHGHIDCTKEIHALQRDFPTMQKINHSKIPRSIANALKQEDKIHRANDKSRSASARFMDFFKTNKMKDADIDWSEESNEKITKNFDPREETEHKKEDDTYIKSVEIFNAESQDLIFTVKRNPFNSNADIITKDAGRITPNSAKLSVLHFMKNNPDSDLFIYPPKDKSDAIHYVTNIINSALYYDMDIDSIHVKSFGTKISQDDVEKIKRDAINHKQEEENKVDFTGLSARDNGSSNKPNELPVAPSGDSLETIATSTPTQEQDKEEIPVDTSNINQEKGVTGPKI